MFQVAFLSYKTKTLPVSSQSTCSWFSVQDIHTYQCASVKVLRLNMTSQSIHSTNRFVVNHRSRVTREKHFCRMLLSFNHGSSLFYSSVISSVVYSTGGNAVVYRQSDVRRNWISINYPEPLLAPLIKNSTDVGSIVN